MNPSKLLLVDDEPLNLMLCTKMLNEFDYEVFTASNGQECIDKAGEIHPDLILLDWNMPIMDGIEVLEILKSSEDTKDIPVIMITGVMSSSENLAFAMSLGAVDFLKKPFEKLEFNARVKNTLLLSSSLRSLREQYQFLENKNLFISSLIESNPQPVTYCNTEGILLMYNEAFGRCIENNGRELIGKSVYPLYRSDEIGVQVQKDIEIIRLRAPLSYEGKVFTQDKTYIVSKNIVTDNNDSPTGIITVLTDITEQKKASEELINAKKIELLSGAMQLMHINELNESIISELLKVLPYASKEGKDIINGISSKFRTGMTEQVWSEFEQRFENTFDTFYKKLLDRFPDLTPTERKLCAMLRLGLSSKEIATLTFQNPQSVDVGRYRLRKKLDLSPNENITDFLLKFESK